jgi:hypothetical protein
LWTRLNHRDNNEYNTRIVDGMDAEKHKYLWIVTLQIEIVGKRDPKEDIFVVALLLIDISF